MSHHGQKTKARHAPLDRVSRSHIWPVNSDFRNELDVLDYTAPNQVL
jgi:hypothetical protein